MSKTSKPNRIILSLKNKINFKWYDQYIALWNLKIYYTRKNIKISYKTSIFAMSASTWSDEFELPYGSYSMKKFKTILNISFKNMINNNTTNFPIQTYANITNNRINVKVKTGYILGILTPELMKLPGCNEKNINKTEVALLHWNVVNSNCQRV